MTSNAKPYSRLAELPDLCPNNRLCAGHLVVIGNDQNRFVGCSNYDSTLPQCKNLVRIAKVTTPCKACGEEIKLVIFILTL